MEQNKSQLEQDYVTLSNDLEGFSLKVNNDSILKKLNDEQKRVQLLLEELRTTKATNVKRINKLKNELTTTPYHRFRHALFCSMLPSAPRSVSACRLF